MRERLATLAALERGRGGRRGPARRARRAPARRGRARRPDRGRDHGRRPPAARVPGGRRARRARSSRSWSAAFARAPPAAGHGLPERARASREHPEDRAALERWLAAGNLLGNHTYSHLDLARVPLPEFYADIDRNEPLLSRLQGAPTPGPRLARVPLPVPAGRLEPGDPRGGARAPVREGLPDRRGDASTSRTGSGSAIFARCAADARRARASARCARATAAPRATRCWTPTASRAACSAAASARCCCCTPARSPPR